MFGKVTAGIGEALFSLPSVSQLHMLDSLKDLCVDLPLMARCNESPKAMNLEQVEQIIKKYYVHITVLQ